MTQIVATALTVYGIETPSLEYKIINFYFELQQHLPFTVLKPNMPTTDTRDNSMVATALTVYGIETYVT